MLTSRILILFLPLVALAPDAWSANSECEDFFSHSFLQQQHTVPIALSQPSLSKEALFLENVLIPALGKDALSRSSSVRPCGGIAQCIELTVPHSKPMRVEWVDRPGKTPWVEANADLRVLMIPNGVDFKQLPNEGREHLLRLLMGSELHPEVLPQTGSVDRALHGRPASPHKQSVESVLEDVTAADAAGIRRQLVVHPADWNPVEILGPFLHRRIRQGRVHVVVSDSPEKLLDLGRQLEPYSRFSGFELLQDNSSNAFSLGALNYIAKGASKPIVLLTSTSRLTSAAKSARFLEELVDLKRDLATVVYVKDASPLRREVRETLNQLISSENYDLSRLFGLLETPPLDSLETQNFFEKVRWAHLNKGIQPDEVAAAVEQLARAIHMTELTPMGEVRSLHPRNLGIPRNSIYVPDFRGNFVLDPDSIDLLFQPIRSRILSRQRVVLIMNSDKDAMSVAQYLNETTPGRRSAAIYPSMPASERNALLQQYREGKIQHIVTSDGTEGSRVLPGVQLIVDLKRNADPRPIVNRLQRWLPVEGGRDQVDALILLESDSASVRANRPLIESIDQGSLSLPKRPKGMPEPRSLAQAQTNPSASPSAKRQITEGEARAHQARHEAALNAAIKLASDYFDNGRKTSDAKLVHSAIYYYRKNLKFIEAMNSNPIRAKHFHYHIQPRAGQVALEVIEHFGQPGVTTLDAQTHPTLFELRKENSKKPEYIAIIRERGRHLTSEQTGVPLEALEAPKLPDPAAQAATPKIPPLSASAEAPTTRPTEPGILPETVHKSPATSSNARNAEITKGVHEAIERVGAYFRKHQTAPKVGEPEYRLLTNYKRTQAFIQAMESDPEIAPYFFYYRQPAAGKAALDVIAFHSEPRKVLSTITDPLLLDRRSKYKKDSAYIDIMRSKGAHLTPEQSGLRSDPIKSVTPGSRTKAAVYEETMNEAIAKITRFVQDQGYFPTGKDELGDALRKYRRNERFITAMMSNPITAELFQIYMRTPGTRVAMEIIQFFEKPNAKLTSIAEPALYKRRAQIHEDPDYIATMEEYGAHLTTEQSWVAPSISRRRLKAIDTAERVIEYVEAGHDLSRLSELDPALHESFILLSSHRAFRARIQSSARTTEAFEWWIDPRSAREPWAPVTPDATITAERTAAALIRYHQQGWTLNELGARDPHLMDGLIQFAIQPSFRAALRKQAPDADAAVEEWLKPPVRHLGPGPSPAKIATSKKAAQRLIRFVQSGKSLAALNWHDYPELYSELIEFASYPTFRAELQTHPETYKKVSDTFLMPSASN